MPLSLRWVGEDQRDRVAETRMLCYAAARNQLPQYIERLRNDRMTSPGDWLLAERDGVAVGTATGIPMTMWVRGGAIACQGVAYVGTVKTSRRKIGSEPGVGTALMHEVIRTAREREFVVSALMPYRATYYEHFGYGLVERRADWTIPLSILPAGDFSAIRFYDETRDREPLVQCRQRIAQRGQADIERSPAGWDWYLKFVDEGFFVIDRAGDGPVRGWMFFENQNTAPAGPDTIKVAWDVGYVDIDALKRLLGFLGSLRDQYSFATFQTQRDFPLNLLLKEPQVTHRTSRNHPTAEARPYTRMQVRVLNHQKLLEAMKLAADHPPGKLVVSIRETEGTESRLAIELDSGRLTATATQATPQVEMPDRIWAMVALGDVPASVAADMGLVSCGDRTALRVLDALSHGPPPFCREYF